MGQMHDLQGAESRTHAELVPRKVAKGKPWPPRKPGLTGEGSCFCRIGHVAAHAAVQRYHMCMFSVGGLNPTTHPSSASAGVAQQQHNPYITNKHPTQHESSQLKQRSANPRTNSRPKPPPSDRTWCRRAGGSGDWIFPGRGARAWKVWGQIPPTFFPVSRSGWVKTNGTILG